jgi:hypothetical protein
VELTAAATTESRCANYAEPYLNRYVFHVAKTKVIQTSAFEVFQTNLDRSRAFRRIFDKDRGVGQPSNDEKELLRGSLVFAVGALDAYLSDLILEVVPEHGPKSAHMGDALKAIARADPGLSLRVALAASVSDSRDEFRAALAEWLASKSFHGPEKVIQALGYLNCPVAWSDLDNVTGRDAAKELTKITDDRHAIVHEGKKPYVRRNLAEQANALVASLAAHIDAEVCKLYPPT